MRQHNITLTVFCITDLNIVSKVTTPVQSTRQARGPWSLPEESPSTPQRLLHPLSPGSSEEENQTPHSIDHHMPHSMDPSIRQLAHTFSRSTVEDRISWKALEAECRREDFFRAHGQLSIPLIAVEGTVVSYDVSSAGRIDSVSEGSSRSSLLPSFGVVDNDLFSSGKCELHSRSSSWP